MAPKPYIRTIDPTDFGARPIPNGIDFYSTPAIRIHNPANEQQDFAVAFADTDQLVQVQVGNTGDDAADGELRVQFWAAGFGTASGYVASFGGASGRETGAPAVPKDSVDVKVEFPWTPAAADLGGAAERHFCIRANVFVGTDPGDRLASGDLVNVPAQARHAQRNMTLRPHVAAAQPFIFELATMNTDPEQPQEFQLEITELTGELQPAEIVHIAASAWVQRARGEGRLTLRGSRGEVAVVPALKRPARRLELELEHETGSCLTTTYEPGEERWITMRAIFDDELEDGVVHRFDVVQRGPEGVVGAARVMTISVPEELLVRDDRAGY